MDGPGEHYAKWNKSIRERQLPYDFTHMCNLKNKINEQKNWKRFIETENREVVTRKKEV